jgi:hypothetical protein
MRCLLQCVHISCQTILRSGQWLGRADTPVDDLWICCGRRKKLNEYVVRQLSRIYYEDAPTKLDCAQAVDRSGWRLSILASLTSSWRLPFITSFSRTTTASYLVPYKHYSGNILISNSLCSAVMTSSPPLSSSACLHRTHTPMVCHFFTKENKAPRMSPSPFSHGGSPCLGEQVLWWALLWFSTLTLY